MTEVDFEYTVRPATESDRDFIVETTARVRQPHGTRWVEWMPYGVCWSERLFRLQDIAGGMAIPPAAWVVVSSGVILGFAMLTLTGAIEMLYVKKEFRGLGFGQILLDAAGMPDVVPCRAPTDSWRMWASRRKIRFTVIK